MLETIISVCGLIGCLLLGMVVSEAACGGPDKVTMCAGIA